MKFTASLILLFLAVFGFQTADALETRIEGSDARLVGVKILVPDLAEAKRFYLKILGFEVANEDEKSRSISLRTNGYKIILEESKHAKRITEPGYSHVSMSFRINDIDETYKRLKAAGVAFLKDEKRKEGVGWSLQILDPFGNKISMMQITVGKPEQVAEPSVYNCGLYVTDIEKALTTYKDALGFVVRSRAYMPEDMPLGTADGKFAFMLHLRRNDFPHVENPNMRLMFEVQNEQTIEDLKRIGLKVKSMGSGVRYLLTDSVGIDVELEMSAVSSGTKIRENGMSLATEGH